MNNQIENQEQEDGFLDFNKIFKIVIKKWYLFVISLSIAFFCAYTYLKYTIPIYTVSSKVFIKDKSAPSLGAAGFLPGSDMFSPVNDLENEIILMKSNTMIERTLNQLDFEYTYYNKGTIRDDEAYPFKGFWVSTDSLSLQLINTPIYITALTDSTFEVEVNTENPVYFNKLLNQQVTGNIPILNFSKVYAYGKSFQIGDVSLQIHKGKESTFKIGHTYYFVANDINTLTRQWLSKITILPENKESSIVNVNVNSPNLNKCIAFANMLANVYVQQGLMEKNQIAVNTINFIDAQIGIIKDTLKEVEGDLVNFRSANKVMDLKYEAELNYTKLKELETERAKLNIRQKYFQFIRQYVSADKDYSALVVPSALDINDPNLIALISQLITLGNERNAVTKNSSSAQNPFLKNVNSQISYTKDALLENLINLTKATEITMNELDKSIRSVQGELNKLPVTERNFLNIERKFNLNDGIYTYLLEKRAEASIAKASSTPDNKVIDYATTYDGGLVSPKKGSVFSLSIFIGLLFPLAYVLYTYFTDRFIYTKEDIIEHTYVPFLGSVLHSVTTTEKNIFANTKSGLSESFRSLKLNLDFLKNTTGSKVIGITSFNSGEGKTFVATNLASIYSLAEKKVLLIGIDMRKPRIDKDLFEDHEMGLSNYLAGMTEQKNIIYKSIKGDNLYHIPSGTIPPNPSELLGSAKMTELIQDLKKTFDVIILDSAPIGLVLDYLNIAHLVDTTIYVVRQGYTPKPSLSIINDLTEKSTIKSTCIVLNDITNEYNMYSLGSYYGKNSGYYSMGDEMRTKWYDWRRFVKLKRDI